MTDNLASPAADDPILTDEQFAAAQREAGLRLAGIALTIARGDREAAAAILRGPLEAIGAIGYEHAHGKYHYGQVREA